MTSHAISLAAALALLTTATAPRRGAQSASVDPVAARVRGQLTALMGACTRGDDAGAMPMLAYRGADRAEHYHRSWRPTDPDAEREARGVCARIRGDLAGGAPVFERYEARRQREGVWHAWTLRFGAQRELFAFIEVAGTYLLGDIDRVR